MTRFRTHYLTAVGGLFALLFVRQASKPFVIDEAEFPLVGAGIARLGRPVYYRGELLPENLGVWHPPGYTYSLGLWEAVFGPSHLAVRLFGFLCIAVTALLGWLIAREIFGRFAPVIFSAWLVLFALHPYVVQSALLPDIDTTILVPTSATVLYLCVRLIMRRSEMTPQYSALVGLALGATFLCKLTTPIALLPAVTLAFVLSRRSIASLVTSLMIALAVAATTFCIVWGSIAAFADLPFSFPFTFTLDSLDQKAGHVGLAERFRLMWPSIPVQFWLTRGFVAAAAIGTVVSLALRRRRGLAILCLMLFGGSVFLTYNVITGPPFGFPKYYTPALLPMAMAAVTPLAFLEGRLTPRASPRALALVLVVTVMATGLLSYFRFASRRTIEIQPRLSYKLILFIGVICAALVLALLARRKGRWPSRPGGASALLGLAALWIGFLMAIAATNTATAVHQASDDASVRYYPGERDFEETVEQLRFLVDDSGPGAPPTIVAAKDIGYESAERYFEDANYFYQPSSNLAVMLRRPGALMVVRHQGDYGIQGWPAVQGVLTANANEIWTSKNGYFSIWRSKTPRPRGEN